MFFCGILYTFGSTLFIMVRKQSPFLVVVELWYFCVFEHVDVCLCCPCVFSKNSRSQVGSYLMGVLAHLLGLLTYLPRLSSDKSTSESLMVTFSKSFRILIIDSFLDVDEVWVLSETRVIKCIPVIDVCFCLIFIVG